MQTDNDSLLKFRIILIFHACEHELLHVSQPEEVSFGMKICLEI